ncbi:DUF1715-domain-containing protein [Sistotremastrum suecicum HHB10207 ss-3]|uniref:DUF1715-domain-containing protein n=1 Tax=Sistotremastrum suecicum HHB10207 ss-3 TaxID=1314776 RepID=A0A166DCW5_9AGAM|nr:DUF1715-domain-containing protein [Sistotremastrum suecicum HHB10207 ss-3]
MDYDLDEIVNLEQRFYDAGHKDGFAHGRIHGLIEGRALGREKGFELWEEIGYYEGTANFWKTVKQSSSNDRESRALVHANQLLHLISRFPRHNPTPSEEPLSDGESSQDSALDISKSLAQIRSRYRAMCASLGVKPRLLSTDKVEPDQSNSSIDAPDLVAKTTADPVWRVDQPAKKAPNIGSMSF